MWRISGIAAVLLCLSWVNSESTPCIPRSYGKSSFVCVCNATYCDTIEEVTKLPPGTFVTYTTSQNGLRFFKKSGTAQPQPLHFTNDVRRSSSLLFQVDRSVTYQSIIGFGGAFTDASGINILSLIQEAQDKLIASYYSKDGLEYNTGRIPISGTDFSTHTYSYNDNPGDLNMTKFNLTEEDHTLKIPLVKKAINMSTDEVKLFASSWSAPAWMKTNKKFNGKGSLIGQPGGEYYKAFALYYTKFLDAYKEEGLEFWGLTAQNEPTDGNRIDYTFNALGFTAETQRDFIASDLGPALEEAGYGDVKLMCLDDQRLFMPLWVDTVLSSPNASKYISGIAVHWYSDFIIRADVLNRTHHAHPDYFLLYTEACNGDKPWQTEKVMLGDWSRGELYAVNILEDLQNWVTGWTDWNLALNMSGGPNWARNDVDSPIIVNGTSGEFYKQPTFYALGHFSKFLTRDSIRIDLTPSKSEGIEVVAFQRPDNGTVVIFVNSDSEDRLVDIKDGNLGYMGTTVPAKSFQTVVWWPAV